MMKDLIRLFYIILTFENVLYQYKKQTHWNNTVAQKGHCRALFLFLFFPLFFVFFLNQRQLDACDVDAFTKVTFHPKNYTTSNYIL